jgi:uncharacterized damage-inducible protein DinB
LKDEDLARNVDINDRAEKRSMPLGELMQHAANHGVHRRGQVALLLRLLGYAPGNFDILFYYADKPASLRGKSDNIPPPNEPLQIRG